MLEKTIYFFFWTARYGSILQGGIEGYLTPEHSSIEFEGFQGKVCLEVFVKALN
jgi:hypothetical protein